MLTGAVLPETPLAHTLGFTPLPGRFLTALALMVVCYLLLIEAGKRWFFRTVAAAPTVRRRRPGHRVHRRAARFTIAAGIAAQRKAAARRTPVRATVH